MSEAIRVAMVSCFHMLCHALMHTLALSAWHHYYLLLSSNASLFVPHRMHIEADRHDMIHPTITEYLGWMCI